MRPGALARPRRPAPGLPPVTDPVCLLITTLAVVVGLVAAGLTSWPARPDRTSAQEQPVPGPQRAQLIPPARAGSRAAVQLLASAATASQGVSYRGVEILDWLGPDGATAAVANVWHQPGREPALQPIAPGLEWPSGSDASPPGSRTLAAVPSLTPQLVSLLAANYAVTMGGQATVAGRAAEVVTIRRPGGGLAATFWLDQATKLPLRRETYQAGGALLSEEAFLSLSLGRGSGAGAAVQTAQAWRDELTGGQLTALRSRGWPLPAALPGQLSLLDARQSSGPSGPVVHLAYSDGLSAVSVFVQRGSLAPRPAGWSRTTLAGHQVYADDASVAWSARGFVFTVITQAPAQTLDAVVGALPHKPAPRPGVLGRMRIGAHRLLRWLGLQR